MKRKLLRILYIVLALLLVGTVIFAYLIYDNIMGSEKLPGQKSDIPTISASIPPVDNGNSDWPNWRGPNFDGKSNSKGIITNWNNGIEKIWSVDFLCQGRATASWSSVVVQGNRLIVPGRDEENDIIFCLNSNDGSLIWKNFYKSSTGDAHGPGARATPVIHDNKVYTYGRGGDLACWQFYDGKLLWKTNVKDIGGEEPDWGLSSTPLIVDDKVIVQGGGKALVAAFNKNTGKLEWKSLEGPAGYSAAVETEIENNKLLLIYHAKALSCLNPQNGTELWKIPWETDYGVNAATPALSGDTLFHSSGYEKGCQAVKISKNGYKILWTNKTIQAQHTDPLLIDGYIYCYSGESSNMKGYFKCVELKTGKEMWSDNSSGMGTCIFSDGYIVCLDIKGNLHLIKPNPKEFVKINVLNSAIPEVRNPAWTSPVIANGNLYLRYMQKLLCYRVADK